MTGRAILIAAHEGCVRSLNREQASRHHTNTLRTRSRGIGGLAVDRWWFLSGIASRQHCNEQAPSAGTDQGDPPVEWILHCMNHRRFGPERVGHLWRKGGIPSFPYMNGTLELPMCRKIITATLTHGEGRLV
jgi:hypothetical protein